MLKDAAKRLASEIGLLLALFAGLTVGLSEISRAQDVPGSIRHVEAEADPIPLGPMEVLVDPSRNLQLADVMSLGDAAPFKALPGNSVNPGFTRNAVWVRFRINATRDRRVLLSLTPNFVDLVDVYFTQERPGLVAADFEHVATGDNRPMAHDAMSGLDNVIPLTLRSGEATLVYIRVAAVNSGVALSVNLYSPAEHTLRTTAFGLVYGLWFGGMAVLLVIQLVFFHFDRKPYYLLLAFATLVAMTVYGGTLGLSRVFLFPEGGIGNDIYTAATSWFGLTASSLAVASILELPRSAPWLNRAFQLGAAVGLVGVGCAVAGANIEFAPIVNLAIVVLATLAALQGLRTANTGGIGTRLRAAAFAILWLGLLATIARRTGVAPLPRWFSQGYAVSILVQTILLTGSLGVRLRDAEALNRTMQAEALENAKSAEMRASALVQEKTRELSHAKQVAEEALRAELASQEQQVRFMEVISHQYRTPLATIRSHVDNIGFSLPEDDHDNRRRLARVRTGINRLVEVLEVNLARSRFQGSSFQPHLVHTSAAKIVAAAGARARDLLQAEIRIEIDSSVESSCILADADMLGIAVINLVENAVKYAASQSSEPPVVLSCSTADGNVVIAVTDRGIGIPKDELPKIFQPSIRGSNVRAAPGTGMGLSLVSRIVSAHRGSIEIASEMGEGTTVQIILPTIAG